MWCDQYDKLLILVLRQLIMKSPLLCKLSILKLTCQNIYLSPLTKSKFMKLSVYLIRLSKWLFLRGLNWPAREVKGIEKETPLLFFITPLVLLFLNSAHQVTCKFKFGLNKQDMVSLLSRCSQQLRRTAWQHRWPPQHPTERSLSVTECPGQHGWSAALAGQGREGLPCPWQGYSCQGQERTTPGTLPTVQGMEWLWSNILSNFNLLFFCFKTTMMVSIHILSFCSLMYLLFYLMIH